MALKKREKEENYSDERVLRKKKTTVTKESWSCLKEDIVESWIHLRKVCPLIKTSINKKKNKNPCIYHF